MLVRGVCKRKLCVSSLFEREKNKKWKEQINTANFNLKTVPTASLSVQTGGIQEAQLLRVGWKHFWLLKLRNSHKHQSRCLTLCCSSSGGWSSHRCLQASHWSLLSVRPSLPPSRSSEDSNTARSFLNNLTGDSTVALKAEAFNSLWGGKAWTMKQRAKEEKYSTTSKAFGRLGWKSGRSFEFSVEGRGRAAGAWSWFSPDFHAI